MLITLTKRHAWNVLGIFRAETAKGQDIPQDRENGLCMNGASKGGLFIESQRIGMRTCKITSNVLDQDYQKTCVLKYF